MSGSGAGAELQIKKCYKMHLLNRCIYEYFHDIKLYYLFHQKIMKLIVYYFVGWFFRGFLKQT